MVDGRPRRLLVHRKGSTRAFPPHHPMIPVDYQLTGQPVLVGGTMGTCSYVLTGTDQGMSQTFGSTCHGAVSGERENLFERYYINWFTILGSRFKPSQVPSQLGLPGRSGQISIVGNLDSRGISETGHGRGARVVQGCDRGGGHVPPGGHKQEVLQTPPNRCDQGLIKRFP